ncbi:hypothetical protein RDI58_016203 [Solanum bulbocastanum]|uniref:Uncharacterized protein n=1 Tax=Solanum bulbocastanum TaxID=147425 RepID=A0AAN8YFS2_SOLBU
MEEGKRKSPRRSPRIHSDGGTSNQKVYRRSRMRGQVSSPTATDDVNDDPILVWESHNSYLGVSIEIQRHKKTKHCVKTWKGIYKNHWEKVYLSLGFCLFLFKIYQNRKVWPP